MSKTLLYRVTLDVDVRARPLTRAYLHQRDRERQREQECLPLPFTNPIPHSIPTERELAPQRALQAELFRDETFLHAWMASEAVQCIQEGYVVVDDLVVEDPHEVLPLLAEHMPAPSRVAVLEALEDRDYTPFLDEFWHSISTVFGRIEIGVAGLLSPAPDTVVGRRFRAVVPVMVEVGEARDVTVERCLRRRHDATREHLFGERPEQVPAPEWEAPIPTESELDHTRALLTAAHADPSTLDHLIRLGIVVDIRDGFLSATPTPWMGDSALRPLIDRLAPAHRAYLLRPALGEDWTERIQHLCFSFDEEPVAITIVSGGG